VQLFHELGGVRILRRVAAFIAVLAPVLAACAPAGAAPRSSPSRAPARQLVRAPLPPELVALERSMLALQVNSESVSASVSFSAPGAPGGPFGRFSRVLARVASSFALLSIKGEESYIPQLARFKGSALGLAYEARLIGNTLYTEEPFIASVDGGRPWVEEPNKGLSQAVGVELQSLGASAGSNATRAFGSMIETLNSSRHVRDIGPYTVDGQATTGFRASVDLAAGRHLSATDRHLLRKLGAGHTHLEAFLAADGLPVRTLLRFDVRLPNGAGVAELSIQSDIAALQVPVVVEAPPAAKTITGAALKRLLEAPPKHRSPKKAKAKPHKA
jgi:hypothetical protein